MSDNKTKFKFHPGQIIRYQNTTFKIWGCFNRGFGLESEYDICHMDGFLAHENIRESKLTPFDEEKQSPVIVMHGGNYPHEITPVKMNEFIIPAGTYYIHPKHGGSRYGAGRPKQKPTASLSFRVDNKLANQVKRKHGKKLKKMFAAWLVRIK